MSTQRGESRTESHQPVHKAAEAPQHGIHHAVHDAHGKDAQPHHLHTPDTHKGTVPDATIHKDHIDFSPSKEATRGLKPPEQQPKGDIKPAAQGGDNKIKSEASQPPMSQTERDQYKVNEAVDNFNTNLKADTFRSPNRAEITQGNVDELAKATKGKDPNQVSDALGKAMGPENYKVSKPDQEGNIRVNRNPVVDKGQDTRAFIINPSKGEGMVINSTPQDNPDNGQNAAFPRG